MSLKTFFFPLAVIISVFLVIWVIIPRWEVTQETKNELELKVETASSLDDKKNKLNQGVESYKNNIKDATVVYNALPSEIDIDSFADELFDGAKNNEILITKMSLDDVELVDQEKKSNTLIGDDENEKAKTSMKTYKFSFDLDLIGGYIETRNFIGFMESANRFFVINDVSIVKDKESSNDVVNTNILGTAYYKEENGSLKVSSVIYDETDPVLKSLIDDGLSIEFINDYKNEISNKDYSFSPSAIGSTWKENLFSSNASSVTEEGGEEI